MRKAFLLLIATLLIYTVFAQPIPADSLYLGQTPPGNIPKIFKLAVSPGFAALERIAISNDSKEIYFAETNGYSTDSKVRIKAYIYSGNKWNDPITIYENYSCPALSQNGKYLFVNGSVSEKIGTGWNIPSWFMNKPDVFHYLQDTYSGTYYVSAKNVKNNVGGSDWSKIIINHSDTVVQSLGTPINTTKDDLDFYISADESYMILSSDRSDLIKYGYLDLYISYRNSDDTWTTPKNLGNIINDSTEARWGPYVSPDKKYLFYSRSSSPDYSDACTYWVRIDNVVESLKNNSTTCY